MPELVLASTSRYRRSLLERFGLPFTVVAPNTDETPRSGESPRDLVARLALDKAQSVRESYSRAVIIGSDQVAVHGTDIIGKPGNHERALEQLRSASGSRVILMTGVAVVGPDMPVQCQVVTVSVWFRQLSLSEMERYLRREQPYDCAGSVKFEGLGIALLERLEADDPTAVIGLPLIETATMLRKAGIDPILNIDLSTDLTTD